MKYANETEMLECYLIDRDNDLMYWEREGFFPTEGKLEDYQIHKVKLGLAEIRRLLKARYPLKAKKIMKDLDIYIYDCTQHLSYNYFDELQRDSHYAY
jgi:hypothetical protein